MKPAGHYTRTSFSPFALFPALLAAVLLASPVLQAQDDFSPQALLQLPTSSWPTSGHAGRGAASSMT